jgi:hypothetical protein
MIDEEAIKLFDILHAVKGKVWKVCNTEKAFSDFPKHSAHKDNLDTRCRACKTETERYLRQEKKKHRSKPLDLKCECCGKEITESEFRFDHDHTTGKFRGWICDVCNVTIGKMGDTRDSVTSYIGSLMKYLKIRKQDLKNAGKT